MKIKLDENLPARLSAVLAGLHHDIHTVAEEKLSGRSDRDVWDAAQRDERFLITQDLDFSDLRRFAPGTHHGILLVRAAFPGSPEPHPPRSRNFPARGSQPLGWLLRGGNGP